METKICSLILPGLLFLSVSKTAIAQNTPSNLEHGNQGENEYEKDINNAAIPTRVKAAIR